MIVVLYQSHHLPEHRLRVDMLSGICWFEIVAGCLYSAVDLIRRNRAVAWSLLNKLRTVLSGYTWRARWENYLWSLTFFNKTIYFAFREISLQ